MTQDKCVYTVEVPKGIKESFVRDFINRRTAENDGFEATIKGRAGGFVFVEVHGDTYEIPVFEQGLEEVHEDVSVIDADVETGGSKFH